MNRNLKSLPLYALVSKRIKLVILFSLVLVGLATGLTFTSLTFTRLYSYCTAGLTAPAAYLTVLAFLARLHQREDDNLLAVGEFNSLNERFTFKQRVTFFAVVTCISLTCIGVFNLEHQHLYPSVCYLGLTFIGGTGLFALRTNREIQERELQLKSEQELEQELIYERLRAVREETLQAEQLKADQVKQEKKASKSKLSRLFKF